MKHKDTSLSSVITLTKQASQKLSQIMSMPPTQQQKRSLQESTGVYAYYQKQWQKKNQ